ncbi:hypothetical protein EDB81DRAFT_859227 [Dactylonectria macrodidyma]|uniref:Uncharacterized protein n=1 Tax=Dactylonectria macrodidyma TaxID=307937 RepID=A0A9P9E9T2_9HYPO|nr:hypothetical protein EDB81DRAFT_859227 [Dactylonectria macrodidyma]
MASPPTTPPSAELEALPLSSQSSPGDTQYQTPASRPASPAFDFSFDSSQSTRGSFIFGQPLPPPFADSTRPNPASSPPTWLSTPDRQGSSQGPRFSSGSTGDENRPASARGSFSGTPTSLFRFQAAGDNIPSPEFNSTSSLGTPHRQGSGPDSIFQFRDSSSGISLTQADLASPIRTPTKGTDNPIPTAFVGADNRGSSSPARVASSLPAAGQQSSSPVPVFRFGSLGTGDSSLSPEASSSTPFSFSLLHNITPLPSPTPSRGASPQPSSTSLQSPFRITPISLSASHSAPAVSSPAPAFSSPIPATPPSAGRSRTLSLASSPSSTPGQQRGTRPSTQQRLTSVSDISVSASEASNSNCGLTDSDATLKRLMEDAKSLRRFQGSDTRTIAVLGDSGEGKSSLINSLLHVSEIAQTADIGSACTSVVTEYRQKKAEHVAPITIEVEYLSASGMKELVKELLWSFRQLYLPGVESDDTSEQDYGRYMRESDQAWSALQSAFQHQRRFTKDFLRDMSEGALERITTQVLQWVEEIEWPSGGNNGFWVSTAQTAEECCEKTKVFMQDKYWPFTKIIRVYLNSQVLRTGVVLADLPGLQDTNLARVRATQDYLIKCDNVFIVAEISRAITDQSLKSSLFWVLSRHVPMEWEQSGSKNFKLAVVCTKSEELNKDKARTKFCGPNKRISSETITELDDEIKAAKSAGDRPRKKAAKKKQEILLIQARNDHVTQGLQRAYAADMEGKTLDVFCVSNTMYQKYSQKGNTEYVMASGIPDLRRFCHSMTADAQLGEAKHFLQSKLSTLLNSLHLWTNSFQNDQLEEEVGLKEEVYLQLNERICEIPSLVGTFRQDFEKCFQEQIMNLIVGRDKHWERAAITEGRRWQTWHFSQYRAWCHNNGNHETSKRDAEDWNAKIIWKMRMELEFQWDLVEEEVALVFSGLLNKTQKFLNDVELTIRNKATSDHATPLASSIDSQIRNFEYLIKREERTFLGEVKAIRRYASDSNTNSFILKEMIPLYRSASSQFGRGMFERQKEIIQGHIEGGTLFPILGIYLSTSMEELIRVTAERLQMVLSMVWQSIKSDVDMVFHSQATLRNNRTESDEKREQLLKKLAVEVNGLKEEHGHLIQTIETL